MKNMVFPVHKDRQKLRLNTLFGYGVISWTKHFRALPNWCSIILETQAHFIQKWQRKSVISQCGVCSIYIIAIWSVSGLSPEHEGAKRLSASVKNRIHSKLLWYERLVFCSCDTSWFWLAVLQLRHENMCAFHLLYGTVEHRNHQIRAVQPLKWPCPASLDQSPIVRLTFKSSQVWLGTWALGKAITRHVSWYNYSFGQLYHATWLGIGFVPLWVPLMCHVTRIQGFLFFSHSKLLHR